MSDNGKGSGKAKISEFSDDSLKEIAKEVVIKRTALLIHFGLYVAVNVLLLGINFGVNSNGFDDGIRSVWAMWSIMGWGIGVLVHFLQYMIFRKGVVNYSSIGAIYHLGVYLIVACFLLFTDWLADEALSWVWWAIGPWGCVVIAHCVFVFLFMPRKAKKAAKPQQEKKSYIDRKVEKELEKLKKKGGS